MIKKGKRLVRSGAFPDFFNGKCVFICFIKNSKHNRGSSFFDFLLTKFPMCFNDNFSWEIEFYFYFVTRIHPERIADIVKQYAEEKDLAFGYIDRRKELEEVPSEMM